MNKKYKVIAIYGESGSGKDTILNWMVSAAPEKTHKIIGHTTRPKREYEINDIDYHFINKETFNSMLIRGDFLEARDFNNWFYGTSITDLKLDKINIGIFSPAALLSIMQRDDLVEVIPLKIVVSDKTRLMRALNRETYPDCEEIARRFLSDKQDFTFTNLENFIIPKYIPNETTFNTEYLLHIINNFDMYSYQPNKDNLLKRKIKI